MEKLKSIILKINGEVERYSALPSDTTDVLTIQDIRKNLFHLEHKLGRVEIKYTDALKTLKLRRDIMAAELRSSWKGKDRELPSAVKIHCKTINEKIRKLESTISYIDLYTRTVFRESNACSSHIKILLQEQLKSRYGD